MTDEQRAARNAYRRAWAKRNPDKIAGQMLRYWSRKAQAETPADSAEQKEVQTNV